MKKFYVVGNKVSKSMSPTIFNYWFKKHNIKAKYGFLELNKKNFDQEIKSILKEKNLSGLNITIPFKKSIIKHLDGLEKHSKKINAVNCVSIKSKITGFNTDWIGYYETLPKEAKLKKNNIIVIGYGGAALSIHYLLYIKGYKNIFIFNRTKRKLNFQKGLKYTKNLNKMSKYLKSADLIINTTPLNPISTENIKHVKKNTILSDIVYSPKETGFLSSFPNNKKIFGISMLIMQASHCFNIWFGFKPTIDPRLLKILEKKIQ